MLRAHFEVQMSYANIRSGHFRCIKQLLLYLPRSLQSDENQKLRLELKSIGIFPTCLEGRFYWKKGMSHLLFLRLIYDSQLQFFIYIYRINLFFWDDPNRQRPGRVRGTYNIWSNIYSICVLTSCLCFFGISEGFDKYQNSFFKFKYTRFFFCVHVFSSYHT